MFFKKDKWQSPNFNEREGYSAPAMIILHYTGMKTGEEALQRLCDPEAEVSAHYVVDEKGKIHHLVDDNKRAWHAGKSYWKGETDINSASIGIEIVNPGHEFGYEEFVEDQVLSVIKLCKDLMKKYDVSPANVLGHSDIAIKRKVDPGHLFPWQRLAGVGLGLWPTPQEMDYQAAEDLVLNKDGLQDLLISFGYDPVADFEEVVIAFHRHFCPEKFASWDDAPCEPDVGTAARLLSLIRQAHEEG